MKKAVWTLWLLLSGIGSAFAQAEDPYAKEKAQIREIKLSNDYYYSDVSSASVEDTKAMARQLVVLSIQQEEADAKGVDSLVNDSCRYIELKRVDRPRIFAYISKEAVAVWLCRKKHPETAKTAETRDTVAVSIQTAAPVKQDTVATVKADTTVVRVDTAMKDTVEVPVVRADTAVAAQQADTQPADTLKQTVAEPEKKQPVVLYDTVKVMVRDTMKVMIRDTTRVTVTDTVRKVHEIKTSGNERLDRIIAMKSIDQVQTHFMAEKKAGRMMFGKMSSAVNPERCYLLVFSREGKVVAVLDKGKDSRVNLTTGKGGDTPANYRGHGIIWFLLY